MNQALQRVHAWSLRQPTGTDLELLKGPWRDRYVLSQEVRRLQSHVEALCKETEIRGDALRALPPVWPSWEIRARRERIPLGPVSPMPTVTADSCTSTMVYEYVTSIELRCPTVPGKDGYPELEEAVKRAVEFIGLEIVGPLATQLLKAAREVQIERMLTRAAQLKTHADSLYKEVLVAWGGPHGKT